MTTYFKPINVSATHIYHSALELSSLSSIVRRLYHHQQPIPFPRVVAGTLAEWEQSIHIPRCGASPNSLPTWSPCGQFVAASYPGAVEIHNAFSSELISTLRPTEPISYTYVMAYSPDGHSFATLSSSSLIIWDVQTGGTGGSGVFFH